MITVKRSNNSIVAVTAVSVRVPPFEPLDRSQSVIDIVLSRSSSFDVGVIQRSLSRMAQCVFQQRAAASDEVPPHLTNIVQRNVTLQ